MKTIVVAMDKNRGIGADGDLPWGRQLPADLAHFKRLTTGGSIIMGRGTFESIGARPLPHRENIVVSQTPTGVRDVLTANSLDSAYALARYAIFIIGGGQLFKEAIHDAERMCVTEVDAEFPAADVFFPEINSDEWHEIKRQHHAADEKNAYDMDFVTYQRRN